MKFEYLEHTADVKFRAYGKTLDEAFGNAALALTPLLTEDSVERVTKREISVSASNKEALLYDFLEELVVLQDTDGFLVAGVDSVEIKDREKGFSLQAVVWFDHAKRYETHGDLKSVTYHEMVIEESADGCMVQVVIDV
ncbi:archease [Candidatus Woesearchaeota archaeon]|nr:archease [Candidatus Woesearchaeota archaeon]|tara:strand:- start:643 stop:1059 length:417 start_codon:yes stop_codon:yes gene_type:complete